MSDRIVDVWGARTPYAGEWPERVDTVTTATPDRWVQSACVLCSTGCALDIGVKDGKMVGVRGRAEDRVNRGRLGPKGLYGWQANAHPDRLTVPHIRRDGALQPASWDEAMELITRTTRDLVQRHTAGSLAFYSTGQIFLEEYYTLAVIGKAGLGTPHMDGNTRLCTATASAALRETFGSDGQPGSFADLDVADVLFLFGHNAASQQTVLWMRILDRLAGAEPPQLVVVDPRTTETARRATVHLAPKLGTNVALMNGLLHVIVENGWYDAAYVDAHAVGFEHLERTVKTWTPQRAAAIADVPVARLEEAAEIIGTAQRLVSTVLQGVYQSPQATAAACQVNNLHVIRGMLGKPGCAVFQMNGQPTAQNTRETGADGEFPALLNFRNEAHMERLAAIWNVDPERIPHWSEPTHIMQILRYCELGSIKLLWIIATNPLVSLPDLAYVRSVLAKRDLFVIVQDAFFTETTELADVVLPTAIWGEKTGTFTNADRTVHLSLQAVDPPGEARSDLDIFLDFARRMDFRDKDGTPLVPWTDAQGAFEAWKACARGQICDYSGLSYEKLTGRSGMQWPCTDEQPDGTERLYTDGIFNTAADRCETYGHDLVTGAAITSAKYRIDDPAGRAIIKPAEYEPPTEAPDAEYPFWLTTGRVVYHFHTRTKTGRTPELDAAAPEPFVEINAADAARAGIANGALVEIRSRRGRLRVPARIAELREGLLFVPFHYGFSDTNDPTAANELTRTEHDPVSKQPYFKSAAVNIAPAER